ncbi:GNAT family N-acetyltransferase [Arcticibacterium luteifluviistationis]|uniref:GNAT family N-acetyltransferase n=1 Tax=Arcticibacterium luteifluviistationis TaxID=1784714 RepID=A0A2Z4GD11_9BACT|nr:GNAT family N-acetyltransferase [Arcticibacterium luteifluviistationis]AWV98915.1 GNAT family N-acetyltransferase [Arcticibacterium luteifluviistationis]
MLKITQLNNENKKYFKELNIAWLEKYFYVEPKDIIQLTNPESEILDKGGYIFMACYNGKTVGTVSLLKVNHDTYELGKMAVDETMQSKGIGKQLLVHAITHAEILRLKKLVLYTNSILKPAISLYQKAGFRNIELGNSLYARSDIKMEKLL